MSDDEDKGNLRIPFDAPRSPRVLNSTIGALSVDSATENTPLGVPCNGDRCKPPKRPETPPKAPFSDGGSDSEFISSGDDETPLNSVGVSSPKFRNLTIGSGLREHTSYFLKSLEEALDLVALDSALASQAQLSGQLNDKSKLLAEKEAELSKRMDTLRNLHKHFIGENRIGALEKDIKSMAARVEYLKHGRPRKSLFGKSLGLGVVDQYPVEYNQARDKVLERTSE